MSARIAYKAIEECVNFSKFSLKIFQGNIHSNHPTLLVLSRPLSQAYSAFVLEIYVNSEAYVPVRTYLLVTCESLASLPHYPAIHSNTVVVPVIHLKVL